MPQTELTRCPDCGLLLDEITLESHQEHCDSEPQLVRGRCPICRQRYPPGGYLNHLADDCPGERV